MNSERLTEILKAAFPEADIAVSGQAGKFDLRIVDDAFEGKRTVNVPTHVVIKSPKALLNKIESELGLVK